MVQAVSLDTVRGEYFTRCGDEASDDAKRVAFNRKVAFGLERRIICVEPINGIKTV